MELHRETFTVNGHYLGERLFLPREAGLGQYRYLVNSTVLICPFCGDLWARRTIIPATGYYTEFFPHRYVCEQCGDGRILSLGGGNADLHNPNLTDFPLSVLRREVLMYAQLFQSPTTQYWTGDIPHVTNPYMKETMK